MGNKEKIALTLGFVFLVLIALLSCDIPFFWDNYIIAQIADDILSGKGVSISYSGGGTIIYYWYISLWWFVFGKGLLISHLAVVLPVFGILYELYRFNKKYDAQSQVFLVFFLFFASSAMLSQFVLMGYDIAFLYLALAFINRVIEKRILSALLFAFLLSLTNLRAIPVSIGLFVFVIWREKFSLQVKYFTLVLLPVVLTLLIFLIQNLSKQPITEDRQLVGGYQILKNFISYFWKWFDNGYFVLYIPLMLSFFKWIFRVKIQRDYINVFYFNALVQGLVLIPLVVFFSNTFGQRYFILMNTFAILGFVYEIRFYKKKIAYVFIGSAMLILVSGHVWMYPVKYGNSWDTTLKVLPLFKEYDDLERYLSMKKVDPLDVSSGFPIVKGINKLGENELSSNINDRRFKSIVLSRYVIYSNVCNEFSQKELSVISHWDTLYYSQKGWVELMLLGNPVFKGE